MKNYNVQVSFIKKYGRIVDSEVILLNGEYGSSLTRYHDYFFTHQNIIKAGGICMKDELLDVLADRKHDRVELRKAHYIAGTASVYLTYAIAVEKE